MKPFLKQIKQATEPHGKVVAVDCSLKAFNDMGSVFPEATIRQVDWLRDYTLVAYFPDQKKIHIQYDPQAAEVW